jgi:protein-tyrosine phosphatase
MLNIFNNNLKNSQSDDHESQQCQIFVDIHCHCLAGFDDGPSTISEAVILCKALVEENIAVVIATPHQLGRFEGLNDAQSVRGAVLKLNKILNNEGVSIKIFPGGEVRVDERICRLLEADKILTLADNGRYILLELPPQVFVDIEPLIRELVSMGIYPVISHVERISSLTKRLNILSKWIEHSATLQITASSLLGGFGFEAARAAWNLLISGWAKLVATDSHGLCFRKPEMKAAYELITSKLGKELANLVCIENPLSVIQGQDIFLNPIVEKQEACL